MAQNKTTTVLVSIHLVYHCMKTRISFPFDGSADRAVLRNLDSSDGQKNWCFLVTLHSQDTILLSHFIQNAWTGDARKNFASQDKVCWCPGSAQRDV